MIFRKSNSCRIKGGEVRYATESWFYPSLKVQFLCNYVSLKVQLLPHLTVMLCNKKSIQNSKKRWTFSSFGYDGSWITHISDIKMVTDQHCCWCSGTIIPERVSLGLQEFWISFLICLACTARTNHPGTTNLVVNLFRFLLQFQSTVKKNSSRHTYGGFCVGNE